MSRCDLCDKEVATPNVVPLSEFQEAFRKGFNPYQTPGIDMSAQLEAAASIGTAPAEMARRLQRDLRHLVMRDSSDWALCSECAQAYSVWRRAVQSSLGQDVRKGMEPADLVSNSQLGNFFIVNLVDGREVRIKAKRHWKEADN